MELSRERSTGADESYIHRRAATFALAAALMITNLAGSTAANNSPRASVSSAEAMPPPSVTTSLTPVEVAPTVAATTEAPEVVRLASIEPANMHTVYVPPEVSTPVSSNSSTPSEQSNNGEITTCAEALAYLAKNANPAYKTGCGYAWGGQAATCNDHAPECPGEMIIMINDICTIAVKNEAANSWLTKEELVSGSLNVDPHGDRCKYNALNSY